MQIIKNSIIARFNCLNNYSHSFELISKIALSEHTTNDFSNRE